MEYLEFAFGSILIQKDETLQTGVLFFIFLLKDVENLRISLLFLLYTVTGCAEQKIINCLFVSPEQQVRNGLSHSEARAWQ